MVVLGANVLIEGSSSIARKLSVSEFVIGFTIVGFGTSLPELVVSVTGALQGNSDIAIGNVVGSNIFNVLFILALSALFSPIAITRTNRKRDIPIVIITTFLLIFMGMSKTIFGLGAMDGLSRIEGVIFLLLFVFYVIYSFVSDKPGESEEDVEEAKKLYPIWTAVIMVLAGLACLIFGGRFFVNSAVAIARMLNVSDKFIAVTILAVGTSLPELATNIVAITKHRSQMALGNILGSNVFNILFILGVSAVITPMSFAGMNLVDMGVLAFSSLIILFGVYTGKRNTIDRTDGAIMLFTYIAYMVWLFIKL
jgi:cation:H+ antiporter